MEFRSILPFAGMLALCLSTALPAQAGSERLIMRTSIPEMTAQGLVHIRLADAGGAIVESDALKAVVVHNGDCQSGPALAEIKDYKFGYFPQGRVSGLFLAPSAWQGKPLCFELPGKGTVSTTIPGGSAGQSLTFRLTPTAAH